MRPTRLYRLYLSFAENRSVVNAERSPFYFLPASELLVGGTCTFACSPPSTSLTSLTLLPYYLTTLLHSLLFSVQPSYFYFSFPLFLLHAGLIPSFVPQTDSSWRMPPRPCRSRRRRGTSRRRTRSETSSSERNMAWSSPSSSSYCTLVPPKPVDHVRL